MGRLNDASGRIVHAMVIGCLSSGHSPGSNPFQNLFGTEMRHKFHAKRIGKMTGRELRTGTDAKMRTGGC